ncbi:hypothetical protein F5X68DRAFT_248122 [Plectosphaerella plurivora]|uniref:Flavin-containing monooxygenase n=1 Tax=Plectosphaerella plurivora TaxID=936078 RepID=A0A9P9ADY7_9PEZI|nr:hypothetical protein F5X68DRAFT_248122 [Plectosphaerella plurivora]
MNAERKIRSVAIIGAGAAGAVTAAAFAAEKSYDRIQVYERRDSPGGTWIYDADPNPRPPLRPGRLAPDIDPPLDKPSALPATLEPNRQERWTQTPIYNSLTTNVPEIAMSFSDFRFPCGPFVPHWVAKQYIENYFSAHKTDALLTLNTTLEDLTRLPGETWRLTLRKHDPLQQVDHWWEETFDAVVLATGHYSVPFVPHVDGLDDYIKAFPDRVFHSKYYRNPAPFTGKRTLVIGNSASGHDVTAELVKTAQLPVYQSRRSRSRWDGDKPPAGIEWKPIIKSFLPSGRILFTDGSFLDDIDTIIYCTGYQPSFPFWNTKANGQPLWDYSAKKLVKSYWHGFFRDLPTFGIVGIPRTLTFRSFEYQAIAFARLWAGRAAERLPSREEQIEWEKQRDENSRRDRTKFHDVPWDDGQTYEYLGRLFRIAGLGTLRGEGRVPPPLSDELVWAVEHVKKYPEPSKDSNRESEEVLGEEESEGWLLVEHAKKDSLGFI